MKKNRMMRLASVLLVAVLMTTCTISGTFAKYVTEGSASDNARVAAWGFGDATTITFNLFEPSYNSAKVLSKDGVTNVIAPGTSQTDTVKLNYADTTGLGAPEVAYKVALNVTASTVDPAIETNENITWTFNGTPYNTFDAMVDAIEAYEVSVAANQLPAIETTGLAIGWAWAFDGGSAMYDIDNDGTPEADQDKYDTWMGNKLATELDEVSLTIQYVATQIQ